MGGKAFKPDVSREGLIVTLVNHEQHIAELDDRQYKTDEDKVLAAESAN